VHRPWKKLRRHVRRVGPDPTDEQLHQVRIRAKHLRYAAEAAEPVIGKPARNSAKAAEKVQILLGSHQDSVVAEQWLREASRRGSPAAAFAAGQLTSEHRRYRQEVRRLWPGAWPELESKRARRWLR
jgi:CHAD domain-containing protein